MVWSFYDNGNGQNSKNDRATGVKCREQKQKNEDQGKLGKKSMISKDLTEEYSEDGELWGGKILFVLKDICSIAEKSYIKII